MTGLVPGRPGRATPSPDRGDPAAAPPAPAALPEPTAPPAPAARAARAAESPRAAPPTRVGVIRRREGLGLAADLIAVTAGVALVAAAALAGWRLIEAQVNIFLDFPPLLASWLPHTGPGTGPALALAAAVVAAGPGLSARLPWRPLLLLGWAVGSAWTLALALVDGWTRGVVERLTSSQEYLFDLPKVHGIAAMLRTFADHILTDRPGFWTTHVGGHPPGAFLVFIGLDRLGLTGGGWAGVCCVLVGASAGPAVAVTLRALGRGGGGDGRGDGRGDEPARRVLPFAVLTPGAVWVGVSADGMFTGVLAWAAALVAVGATGRGRRADLACLVGGLLGGYCLYLSYGLVLGGLVPLAVLAVARRARAAVLAGVGAAAVVAAFTAAGFWWFTGYRLVQVIYDLSIAKDRPYEYFWWADLAALMFLLGPAVLAGLRRALAHPRAVPAAVAMLVGAAVLAIAVADVSGMSRGEVERIWLPFAAWLAPVCVLLPARQVRGWLAAQALLALAVNHLLLTVW